jgi:hypothetical protein
MERKDVVINGLTRQIIIKVCFDKQPGERNCIIRLTNTQRDGISRRLQSSWKKDNFNEEAFLYD